VDRRLFTVGYKIHIHPEQSLPLPLLQQCDPSVQAATAALPLCRSAALPLCRLRRRDKMPASPSETSWRSTGPVSRSITFTTRAVTLLRCKSFERTSLVVAAADQTKLRSASCLALHVWRVEQPRHCPRSNPLILTPTSSRCCDLPFSHRLFAQERLRALTVGSLL
jgi:hypothetical protein